MEFGVLLKTCGMMLFVSVCAFQNSVATGFPASESEMRIVAEFIEESDSPDTHHSGQLARVWLAPQWLHGTGNDSAAESAATQSWNLLLGCA